MEGLQRPRPHAIFRESPGFRLTEELSLACVTNGQEIVDCTREIEPDETHVYSIAKYMQLFVESSAVDVVSTYWAVGMANSAPLPMLSGQRCMTDFCLV